MSEVILSAFEAYGIEIEYMIVDAKTLEVAPLADILLTTANGELTNETDQGALAWSNELALHVVELKTNGPTASLEAAASEFHTHVARANALLEPYGARLMPTGAHPWMNPAADSRLWPHGDDVIYRTYDRIFGCHGHGWTNLQSTHLNLPFADDSQFARLHAAVRAVLPLLPALAASSPVLDASVTGTLDTRLATYRHNQARIGEITGRIVPEPVASKSDYQTKILKPMYRAIAPLDPEAILQHEWLNSRGAIARFDRHALEIRLLDTQEHPAADLAITALVVATVQSLYGDAAACDAANAIATDVLAAILERCIQEADATPIDQREFLTLFGATAPVTAGELWRDLATRLGPFGAFADGPLGVILEEGPLARRILTHLCQAPTRPDLARTYAELCQCLADGRMFRAAA